MCEENNHLFDTFYAFHAQNKISVFKVKIGRTVIHVKFITVKWGRLFCIFHAWHWGFAVVLCWGFAVVCSGLQWSCGVLITLWQSSFTYILFLAKQWTQFEIFSSIISLFFTQIPLFLIFYKNNNFYLF